MKRLIMGAFFCFCVVGAMAQIRRTVAAKPKADSVAVAPDMVTEEGSRKGKIKALDLNKQQKRKLKGVMQSAKQEKAAIENDEKLSDAEKKQRLQALRKRQMAHLDSVLTSEQKQQMLKMRREKGMQKRKAAKGNSQSEPTVEAEMKQ